MMRHVIMAKTEAPDPSNSAPSTAEISVNGVVLHYVTRGEGQTVLLVHGTLGDYRSWVHQIEPFSRLYRVISYSRRYHYPNDWPSEASSFSVQIHADDLAALIAGLDIGPVHLVGHSFGGFASLLVARDHPELLRSLTLAEPPVVPLIAATPEGSAQLEQFNPFSGVAEAFRQGNTRQGVRSFVDSVVGSGAYDGLPSELQVQMLENARELNGEACEASPFTAFSCEDVQGITDPTMLVTGERSPAPFLLIQDKLAECLPTAERATIPGASHGLIFENPGAFNNAVLRFLADI